MEAKIVYFDKLGPDNTDEVFRIARRRAEELGIKKIIIASTTGATARKALDALAGFKLIFVSHSAGFREPNVITFSEETRKLAESRGATVVTGTHALAGVSRALRNKTNTVSIGDILAETLRILGQGMKVVCEITVMAADAGCVRTDEEVAVIAGSSRGADTAVVLTPVNSQSFFDLRVKEILCKPRL